MKKYLKYIVISLLMFLTLNFSVSALDCYYIKDDVDVDGDGHKDTLEAHFRVNENNNKIVFSGVHGMMQSTDDNNKGDDPNLPPLYRTVKGQGQRVENWNKNFSKDKNITYVGVKDTNYTNKKECPKYAYLIDRAGQFDLLVSDEPNKTSVENYGNGDGKQGMAQMTLQTSKNVFIRYPSSCLGLNEKSCKLNENYACVWNETSELNYCNVDNLLFVGCGGANDIPLQVPGMISLLINLLKIATPIILIFVSVITLIKALGSQKEDEIKKAQSSLVRKLIAAAMVFFVISIVQFVISFVASDDGDYKNFENCLDCFVNNNCNESKYYKTNVLGVEYCTPLKNGKTEECDVVYSKIATR